MMPLVPRQMNEILDASSVERIAYFDSEVRRTYTGVEACARALNRFPARVKDAQQGICILMCRCALYIAAVLAAWRAGFYAVLVNTAWPHRKNLDVIQRIHPAAVLIDDDSLFDDHSSQVLRTSTLFAGNHAGVEEMPIDTARRLLASDVAYVIFKLASTGEPKGVVISAGAFPAYIDWTWRYFADHAESKRLSLTSELIFDITMGEIAFALAFGTYIGVARHNTNIPSVLAMVMRHQIDVLYSVPATHLALLSFARHKRGADLRTLKLILAGGDRFPWQLVKGDRAVTGGADFYSVYGPNAIIIDCLSKKMKEKLAPIDSPKSVSLTPSVYAERRVPLLSAANENAWSVAA